MSPSGTGLGNESFLFYVNILDILDIPDSWDIQDINGKIEMYTISDSDILAPTKNKASVGSFQLFIRACICVIAYLRLCICVFEIWEHPF